MYITARMKVERERAKDEANGLVIAKALAGLIKRKVIKQTVMTTVYGVTRFGARLQMVKQLKGCNQLHSTHGASFCFHEFLFHFQTCPICQRNICGLRRSTWSRRRSSVFRKCSIRPRRYRIGLRRAPNSYRLCMDRMSNGSLLWDCLLCSRTRKAC